MAHKVNPCSIQLHLLSFLFALRCELLFFKYIKPIISHFIAQYVLTVMKYPLWFTIEHVLNEYECDLSLRVLFFYS